MKVVEHSLMRNPDGSLYAKKVMEQEFAGVSSSPSGIVRIMNSLYEMNRRAEEYVYMLAVSDVSCSIFEISHGNTVASVVPPDNIFRRLLLVGQAGFVLCHNHPNGSTSITKNDREVTEKIMEASELMGLSFLDHIIIAGSNYVSMMEETDIWKKPGRAKSA